MSVHKKLARFVLSAELELLQWRKAGKAHNVAKARKRSAGEVCPRCSCYSESVYDHRTVRVKDAPVRGSSVVLTILKRRFYCHSCRKPFTEPVAGIWPKQRTTQRYRRSLLWACENFQDLKKVQKAYRCSSAFLYKVLYEQLRLRIKSQLNYPWPETVGIDEIFFRRGAIGRVFVTVIVDYKNKRVLDLIEGRNKAELIKKLSERAGVENVRNVIMDMSGPYKSLAKELFPQAKIIADKFHVIRLLNPVINRMRKEITGDKRTNPIRRLLLKSRHRLKYFERRALDEWLKHHPHLAQVYSAKEALMTFYRTRGQIKAHRKLIGLCDTLALSNVPELKRFRTTLMSWHSEITNYFRDRLTNGRTEGFNNKLSLVKRRAFGYRRFENFRLRALNACL